MLLSISSDFIFISENVVSKRKCLVYFFGVEVDQEFGREVKAEWLLVVFSELGNFNEGFEIAGDEETGGVDDLCLVKDRQVCLKVLKRILEASSKVSAECSES